MPNEGPDDLYAKFNNDAVASFDTNDEYWSWLTFGVGLHLTKLAVSWGEKSRPQDSPINTGLDTVLLISSLHRSA